VGPLDGDVLRFVASHRTHAFTSMATGVEAVGDSPVFLAVLALAVTAIVVLTRAWRVGAAGALAVVVATLAAVVLKDLAQRPRPQGDLAVLPLDGWAMPSTHAARTAALGVAVLVAGGWLASGTRWRAGLVAVVVALNVVVGGLMVYLGAHWPTDVLAGWLLGGAVGCAVGLALRRTRSGRMTS
jgi:membrane-associated phospholipid phosphatase